MNNGVDIICDICPNVKMSLTKTVGTKQSGKQYRMRWFKCPVCGMSDLIKPIEHKGERFVPIVKLAKMSYPNHEWKLSSSGLYACVGNGYMTFEYDYGYNCFLCNNSAQLDQLKCLFKAH